MTNCISRLAAAKGEGLLLGAVNWLSADFLILLLHVEANVTIGNSGAWWWKLGEISREKCRHECGTEFLFLFISWERFLSLLVHRGKAHKSSAFGVLSLFLFEGTRKFATYWGLKWLLSKWGWFSAENMLTKEKWRHFVHQKFEELLGQTAMGIRTCFQVSFGHRHWIDAVSKGNLALSKYLNIYKFIQLYLEK